MNLLVSLVLLLLLAAPCSGEDFTVLGGGIWGSQAPDSSFTWQLDYRHKLSEHLAAGFTYLNEGHLPDHHRDGHSFQLWADTGRLLPRFSLAAGVGPYFFYDTIPEHGAGLSRNDHGWGALASVAATWQTESPWLVQLRSNWVTTHDIDTYGVLFGVGYRFGDPSSPGLTGSPEKRYSLARRNEITLFAGPMTVNNAGNPHSGSVGIEYRRGLLSCVDWTASVLYEGSNRLTRRYGLASQLWLVRAFLDDTTTLGFGAGPYLAIDDRRDHAQGGSDPLVAGITTLTGSYRLHANWGMRFSWNRIITSYDRDADLWLAGLAYRF